MTPGFLSNLSAQNQDKPQMKNVLFIAIDDLKPLLGCYGDPIAQTPNMDSLAAKGTLFTLAYCQQAVSGPTRASLLTGLRPDHTKMWDMTERFRTVNPDAVTIPQYFCQNGYETAGIGKIFDQSQVSGKTNDVLSWSIPYMDQTAFYDKNTEPPTGFRGEYQATEIREAMKTKGEKFVQENMFYATECVDVPDGAYKNGAITNGVEQFLQNYKTERPFFLAVGFQKPHLPFVAPKKYWDVYKREQMPLAKFSQKAAGSPDFAYTNSGELPQYSDIPAAVEFSDIKNMVMKDDKARQLIHGYYACVSYTDAQIGKVIAALDKKGVLNNTIIVLWGDHGWHLGDHGLWCKHTNFEQATHSPLIIIDPSIKSSKVTTPVEFVDIYPTLCELAGLSKPQNLDGISLVAGMKTPKSLQKKYAVSQYPRDENKMGYSLRDGKYRYTVWVEWKNRVSNFDKIIAEELYDYEKDPLETVNQVNAKSYVTIVKTMKQHVTEYIQSQKIQ
ncbi:MAG: sulfatase, partial [Paludibacter sp.]